MRWEFGTRKLTAGGKLAGSAVPRSHSLDFLRSSQISQTVLGLIAGGWEIFRWGVKFRKRVSESEGLEGVVAD